ncbi:secretin N-terminal domain-containing protein [Pararhodobacter zhoushanensis]|uniref:Type II secretion system protein GspD n=1 Tax=Pararhodobacter zhoushanensis TaxID=2479545 RepID=A0ABT3GVV0_9RHOB|nr:secretin N-terminal domain-containing protein [Pararhodobacter zhoushanensis]MCW1931671.1 type II secretion system protein GspD [Pararhodobacter zhoushanensis]
MTRFAAFLLLGLLLAFGALRPASAQIRLDLRDVDLRSYIQLVSEQTGRNFLVDPEVQGTVSVYAPVPVTPASMYEIFLNVLEINGVTILEGEGIDRIVPMHLASGLAAARAQRGGGYETRVIPVRGGDIVEMYDVLEPLVAPDAILTPIPSAGLFVLSDRTENITRIEALIERLNTASSRSVETIRLNHGRASEMITVLQAALPPTAATGTIAADPGANAIVVSGPSEFRDRVRSVVMQLDTPQMRPTSRVVRLNFAQATELADVIRQSMGAGGEGDAAITIVAEPQSNAIIITAPQDRVEAITRAIQSLDTRPSQVLIEAVIFEVSAENFSDLSVQFGGLLNDAIGGGTSFALDGRTSLITLISAAMAGNNVNPGNGGVLGASDGNFAALLTAIARERSTRLLSTPAVLTLNNQEAEIIVAQNVPFVTGQYSTVGDSAVPDQPFQTIERQDVGLTLTVRPQITDDGTVRMAIAQEVSNLTGTTSAAGGEVTARRRLSTNALVGDGEVIILGGLIEDNSTAQNQRVPGLSNLPVLGALFRGRSLQEGQRVLLIMLRPRVVRDDHQATALSRQIARETERLGRLVSPRNTDSLYPQVRRTGFPFDGVDLNQPFDDPYVDQAVRDRLFPPLPPRLQVDQGQ